METLSRCNKSLCAVAEALKLLLLWNKGRNPIWKSTYMQHIEITLYTHSVDVQIHCKWWLFSHTQYSILYAWSLKWKLFFPTCALCCQVAPAYLPLTMVNLRQIHWHTWLSAHTDKHSTHCTLIMLTLLDDSALYFIQYIIILFLSIYNVSYRKHVQ